MIPITDQQRSNELMEVESVRSHMELLKQRKLDFEKMLSKPLRREPLSFFGFSTKEITDISKWKHFDSNCRRRMQQKLLVKLRKDLHKHRDLKGVVKSGERSLLYQNHANTKSCNKLAAPKTKVNIAQKAEISQSDFENQKLSLRSLQLTPPPPLVTSCKVDLDPAKSTQEGTPASIIKGISKSNSTGSRPCQKSSGQGSKLYSLADLMESIKAEKLRENASHFIELEANSSNQMSKVFVILSGKRAFSCTAITDKYGAPVETNQGLGRIVNIQKLQNLSEGSVNDPICLE